MHFNSMQRPIDVDLPHKLGRDEARRRLATNIHKLQDHIPGGASHVDSSWTGDRLNTRYGSDRPRATAVSSQDRLPAARRSLVPETMNGLVLLR